MARILCMSGTHQYCPERKRGLCKRRLKIPGLFLLLGLNFAKVTLLRSFLFSLAFCKIIYFEYLKNEYTYGNLITGYAYLIIMGSRI